MENKMAQEKSVILRVAELLENSGFRVLGVNYNNNDPLEPIIISIGNGLTASR
jgi:hypothetical protein